MLIPATPPTGVVRVLEEELPSLLAREFGLTFGDEDAIEVAVPQPIYTAGIESFLFDMPFRTRPLTSWQFLVLRNRETFGAAEIDVATGPDGAPFLFGGFRFAPYTASVIDALRIAEELPEVESADFEVRVLRAPVVYLYAVWLFRDEQEILIPCDPAPHPLQANAVLGPGQVRDTLREVAAYRAAVGLSDQ